MKLTSEKRRQARELVSRDQEGKKKPWTRCRSANPAKKYISKEQVKIKCGFEFKGVLKVT